MEGRPRQNGDKQNGENQRRAAGKEEQQRFAGSIAAMLTLLTLLTSITSSRAKFVLP